MLRTPKHTWNLMHLPGWDGLRVDKSQSCGVHLYDVCCVSRTHTVADGLDDMHHQHTGCCLRCKLTSGAAWIVTEDLKGTSAADVLASSSLQGNNGLKVSHCTTTVCASGVRRAVAECLYVCTAVICSPCPCRAHDADCRASNAAQRCA